MNEIQKQAWITSLRILTASPKSAKELAGKLREKGYPEKIIEETLMALREKAILNDRSFATAVLTKFQEIRPSGRHKIAFELKRRGIAKEVCAETLAKIRPEDERALALELTRARWDKWEGLTPEKRKKRTYDFLSRRGFDYELIRDVVESFSQSAS